MKFIGFDIEITKEIPEGIEWKQIRPLRISCASAVSDDFVQNWYGTNDGEIQPSMSVEEVKSMVEFLSTKVQEGYALVTWNGLQFDFDVLAEESNEHELCKTLSENHYDLMFQFFCYYGFPVGLDKVAKGLGLPGKTEGMHGDLAPIMWANKEFDKVLEYVEQDSRTTLEVANEILIRKYVRWITKAGKLSAKMFPFPMPVKDCLNIPIPDNSWMTNPMSRESYYEWWNKQDNR